MKKIIIFVLLLSPALVFAFYYFSDFSFAFEIKEPVLVEYHIALTGASCNLFNNEYKPLDGKLNDFGELYPKQHRKICFRFTNQAKFPFDLTADYQGNWEEVMDFVIDIPETIEGNSIEFGKLQFYVKPDASGSFSGTLEFGRE